MEGCLGTNQSLEGRSEMETFDGVKDPKMVSGLDKMVAEEAFGSWMVVDWRRGRRRSFKNGYGGRIDGTVGGSRFQHWKWRKERFQA